MKIDIDDLINRILRAEMTKEFSSGNGTYQSSLLYGVQKPHVERIIREWYNDQISEPGEESPLVRIAELEAKVYAYEQIIAKSNFAPMISDITEAEQGEVCPE